MPRINAALDPRGTGFTVPVLWARWWDIGDSAVFNIMLQPTHGDKAYWASRIFSSVDDVWLMSESYHTYIDASPVMTTINPTITGDERRDLRNIDLTSTIIRGANLSDTNLEGKNLSGMDLRGINFSNANLRDADLTDSIFSKTIQISGDCQDENQVLNVLKNFTCITEVINNESIRTDFRNADLSNAKFGTLRQDTEQMIYFADFRNADLSNIKVNSVQFFGCDFSNTKLDGMAAKQMFIVKSDFNNTMMNNFEISETWIQTTSFNNVEMTNGIFDDITFIDTHFLETNLDGTIISNLNEMDNNTYDCKNNPICNK